MLLEPNPRMAAFQATSGLGLDPLPTAPWTPGPDEWKLLDGCFDERAPTIVRNLPRLAPGLATRLGTPRALLLPAAEGAHRAGILAIGLDTVPARLPSIKRECLMEIAEACLVSLELFRRRHRDDQARAASDLLNEATASLSATLTLTAGLDTFCEGAGRLFGAVRTTVWIHDRRSHHLVLGASSDPQYLSRGFRLSVDEAMPPALAMRRRRPEMLAMESGGTGRMVTVPLRGWRRALGSIVFEGVPVEAGEELDLLERCSEVGRSLSTAVEGMQLLESVLASDVRTAAPDTGASISEAEREEVRRRSTRSEELPALGVFVAGIAHELNNPLQGVLGHLELLRATGAFPRQLRREVQTIYREADRAARIVRNLLMFTGARRLARREVNVNAVFQKVVTLRQAPCRALGIKIVRHYDSKLPRVEGDPLALHQVFLNMVINAEQAIAATGRPGRIELTTARMDSSRHIVATVRDTGSGISSGDLNRIFEPFYTTKEVGKGTGLGLAIAYGIVREHNGHVSAGNAPGGGAIFTVELPAAAAKV